MSVNFTELKNLVDTGLSTYEIAKVLNISQTTTRYWLKKYDLKTCIANKTISNNKNCLMCTKQLTGKQSHFCSLKCKNDYNYTHKQQRGLVIRTILLNNLGGKCSECGYSKNSAALEFHHLNPKLKTMKLDIRNCSNRKFSTLVKEANKCVILCSNCHTELHNPERL